MSRLHQPVAAEAHKVGADAAGEHGATQRRRPTEQGPAGNDRRPDRRAGAEVEVPGVRGGDEPAPAAVARQRMARRDAAHQRAEGQMWVSDVRGQDVHAHVALAAVMPAFVQHHSRREVMRRPMCAGDQVRGRRAVGRVTGHMGGACSGRDRGHCGGRGDGEGSRQPAGRSGHATYSAA